MRRQNNNKTCAPAAYSDNGSQRFVQTTRDYRRDFNRDRGRYDFDRGRSHHNSDSDDDSSPPGMPGCFNRQRSPSSFSRVHGREDVRTLDTILSHPCDPMADAFVEEVTRGTEVCRQLARSR